VKLFLPEGMLAGHRLIHLKPQTRQCGQQPVAARAANRAADDIGSDLPCLVNLQPSGEFLMEDFYYAGGLPAVLRELGSLLHQDALTVNGATLGANNAAAECYDRKVILPLDAPFKEKAGIAVLKGNLAPFGAVINPSASATALLVHRGCAVVFESIEDLHARIGDEQLDIDETCAMGVKGAGPKGYPGFAEVGNMPLPPKVLRADFADMVRISDGRMSGTAYGTVVLHVSPEAAIGGPLALVQSGDMVELDVPARRLHLDVSDAELARRRALWVAPPVPQRGGYPLNKTLQPSWVWAATSCARPSRHWWPRACSRRCAAPEPRCRPKPIGTCSTPMCWIGASTTWAIATR
jgi:dihydroxy-acid dehydratase